ILVRPFLPLLTFLGPDSADPRALPSFPTRRSSDLLGPGDIGRVGDHHVKLAEKPAGRGHGVGNQAGDPAAEMEVAGVFLGNFQRDRKSTRLNSSHVSISYAVFCL